MRKYNEIKTNMLKVSPRIRKYKNVGIIFLKRIHVAWLILLLLLANRKTKTQIWNQITGSVLKKILRLYVRVILNHNSLKYGFSSIKVTPSAKFIQFHSVCNVSARNYTFFLMLHFDSQKFIKWRENSETQKIKNLTGNTYLNIFPFIKKRKTLKKILSKFTFPVTVKPFLVLHKNQYAKFIG